MNVSVEIEIEKSRAVVWSAITDIDHAAEMISAIIELQVVERPATGLPGLKWKETRMMFGKPASETMWITEAVENEYYCTRAESHGSVYITRLSLAQQGAITVLTMSFSARAQSAMTKVLAACMGVFVKRSMVKMLRRDLQDIKQFVERG